MNNRDAFVKETIEMLKDRYGLSLSELIEFYHGEISIPASIYDSDLTPLEATSSFLSVEKGLSEKEIAEVLKRPKSTIHNALGNAGKKGITPKEDESSVRIPLGAFRKELSPSEAICLALHEQDMRNVDIAKVLGKDQRNVWQLIDKAKRRLSDE